MIGKMFKLSASLLIILALTVSCYNERERGDDITLIKKIMNETGLLIPMGSIVSNYAEPDVVIDPVWAGKVKIPTPSLDEFKKSISSKKTDTTVCNGLLADSLSWWNPSDVISKNQYLANDQTMVIVTLSKEVDDFYAYIECVVF